MNISIFTSVWRLALSLLLFIPFTKAGEIILPAPAMERDGIVSVVYRMNSQATGKGELTIRWTDVHGRAVEDRKLPVVLADEMEIRFELDMRRAAAMRNELEVRFVFDGTDKKGRPDHREDMQKVSFVAKPPYRQWWDYIILMWQNYSRKDFELLKTMGIDSGQYNGKNVKPPDFLLSNDLRWYAENIATDFYSEYHRWRPDRIQNWSYLQAKELYKKDRTSKEAFKRHPSLSDPVWVKRIHDRLVESARNHSPYRPVFYSLGDESGVADLASYWDFDFSDHSLAEMRRWLKERYGTLPALNKQWGTDFASWDRVVPDTTDEAMKRTDGNYSAWSDHKEWMDVSFSRALKMGADAVRSVDPDAYVGIGGAQMPGWGGYDYSKIVQAVSALEPYDIGNNIEIIRSLNPELAVVTVAFARGPWEKHRVWYELLHGNRGLLIWDDKNEFVTKEGTPGERGLEVKPYYLELKRGIASLLMNSERRADPIAIHYSQPSMRTEWMLAQRPKGEAWVNRGSATERLDSEFMRLRETWCRLIEDLALQYNFVSYAQVEEGELIRKGYRVLVLPRSTSLSESEAREIRSFVEQGGVVIADGEPGSYDAHSRKLAQSSLADLLPPKGGGIHSEKGSGKGKLVLLNHTAINYHQQRLVGKEGAIHQWANRMISDAGVQAPFKVTGGSGQPVVGVETHRFVNGGVTIVGVHSNPQLRVNELGPPEFKSNERFEKPQNVKLALPSEMQVYELRTGKHLGRLQSVDIALDPYEPVLYDLSALPLPELRVVGPATVKRGANARIGISVANPSLASMHVMHVEVVNPWGDVVPHYSGNLLAPHGSAGKLIPIATNDPAGKWQVRVRDVISGQTKTVAFDVK
ncbi:MAG: beta-galactosidase [Bryobacteraceae bacterium]|nr:beta-galactosidase [Bryobacteraceae bacterium]